MTTPAQAGLRAEAGLPLGMTVTLDAGTKQVTDDVLFGGSPARVLRLNAAGVRALDELRRGPITTSAGAVLARRLTDAGLAHPQLPHQQAPHPQAPEKLPRPDVTVVIPVFNRAQELARCLAVVGAGYPIVVVDDGSADPDAIAAVCAAHGARLLRRDVNGGPAAARNTALAAIDTESATELVAFLDSDCTPDPGWIEGLAGHFEDPLLAAVAPRIVAGNPPSQPSASQPGASQPGASQPRRAAGATLDLGDQPARVAPLTKVSYLPTAALLVRRAAIGTGFDEALRHGEDVDLVWRLIEAGWRVRYEPAVQVAHSEPSSRGALLYRRFRYGTSAAPLSKRHPGAVVPLVLQPGPTITMTALLAGRPLIAGAAFGTSTALLARRLRASNLPATGLVRPMADGVVQTWLGTGRWVGQFAAPAALAVIARPGGRTARARWTRRVAAASLLAGPPLADWATVREGHPLRHVVEVLADQAAYGAGVYAGCLRERLAEPLLPSIGWHPIEGLSRGKRRPADPPVDM